MRCPDCNKFVGYDDSNEPDVDLEATTYYDGDGAISIHVTGSVRGMLSCDQCSTELKEATFDVDEIHEEKLITLPDPAPKTGDVVDCDIEVGSSSITDRMEDKDRRGKPIKNPRYMKRMFGVEVEYSVEVCGQKFEYTFSDELQASAWDELV